MARSDNNTCLNCIRDDLRLTEQFASGDAAITRVTDLSAKGMQHYACHRTREHYFVCYRGIPSSHGLLPRYEGQIIDGP